MPSSIRTTAKVKPRGGSRPATRLTFASPDGGEPDGVRADCGGLGGLALGQPALGEPVLVEDAGMIIMPYVVPYKGEKDQHLP